MVWKDRIICDLKNKKFDKWQYDYFIKIYNSLTPELYTNTKQSSDFKKEIIESWRDFTVNKMDYSKMMPTLFLLADDIIVLKKIVQKTVNRFNQ